MKKEGKKETCRLWMMYVLFFKITNANHELKSEEERKQWPIMNANRPNGLK
jgi:hypothetical protein